MWLIALLIVFVPVLVFCVASVREYRRTNDVLHFFLYGESLRRGDFLATLASSNTALGAVLFIITVYGYYYGLGCLPWVVLLWLTTQWASWYVMKHADQQAGGITTKRGTLHEFLGAGFAEDPNSRTSSDGSRRVRIAAAAVSFAAYIGLVSAEFLIGRDVFRALIPEGTLQSPLFTLSPVALAVLLIGLVTVLVAAYSSLAGFRAVIKTDEWQLLQIAVLLTLVWVFLWPRLGAFWASYHDSFPAPLSAAGLFDPAGDGWVAFVVAFGLLNVLFWGGWWPAAMDQWQRCAATEADVSRNPFSGTAGFVSTAYFAILSTTFVAVGSYVRVVYTPTGDDPQPLLTFLAGIGTGLGDGIGSTVFVGFVAAGLIAAFVSTTDSYLVVATQSLISDIKHAKSASRLTVLQEDDQLNHVVLRQGRLTVALLPAVVFVVAWLISIPTDLFTFIYGFFALMFAVLPAILVVSFGRGSPDAANKATVSILVGAVFAVGAVWFLIANIEAAYAGESSRSLTFWYNLLYAASPVTAVVAGLVYLGVPRSKT